MNKKNNLALYTLFFVGLFSSLILNTFAQNSDVAKTEQQQQKCSSEKFVMPQSISVNNGAFANFIKVMSLPGGERQKAFSDLPNEEKANIFKVQLALNFIKRQDLTREQKDLILNSISIVRQILTTGRILN